MGDTLGGPSSRFDDIKMDLKEIECECVNFIQLAEHRIQWLVVLNTIKLRALQKARISWLAERLLVYQEGLWSVELITCILVVKVQTETGRLKIMIRINVALILNIISISYSGSKVLLQNF
jgi:hypothetical protein